MNVPRLSVVDAETLLATPLPKTMYIVDNLLPQGLSIFAEQAKLAKAGLCLTLQAKLQKANQCGDWQHICVMSCILHWRIQL